LIKVTVASGLTLRIFVALFLMPLTGSAVGETIQLEREHGTYMIPVRINDSITLPFILDTGASDVSIPADVFLTLTRTGTVKPSDFVGTGTYTLADGSQQSSERFVLHELRVGEHVVRNVIASVVPVKGDPLLGQSFLAKLPSWTIDNERHALVLNDRASPVVDIKIVNGNCDLQSHIAEGIIGDDLTKRQSRFYCDSAVISFYDREDKHIMVQFVESKSHHGTQLGFSGLMENDGQMMDVRNVYLKSDKPISVTGSHCKFFFKDKRMSGIFCGTKIDEEGRRTVASIIFDASPEQ
jgi:clan AA aspartic protease (TIGR02281 family)